MVPVVSVDLPDPWDPLDWLEPLVSLDVRYEETSCTCRLRFSVRLIYTGVRMYQPCRCSQIN